MQPSSSSPPLSLSISISLYCCELINYLWELLQLLMVRAYARVWSRINRKIEESFPLCCEVLASLLACSLYRLPRSRLYVITLPSLDCFACCVSISIISLHMQVFSLDCQESFEAIYSPSYSSGREKVLERIAEQLSTVCATLGEYPSIRYRQWVSFVCHSLFSTFQFNYNLKLFLVHRSSFQP